MEWMMEWKMEWNSDGTQLQLTHVRNWFCSISVELPHVALKLMSHCFMSIAHMLLCLSMVLLLACLVYSLRQASLVVTVVFETQTLTRKAKVWLHKTIVMEINVMAQMRKQNSTCEVSNKGVVMQPGMFLSKQVWTIVTGRWRDPQMINVPGAYTLLGKPKAMLLG